MRGRSKSLESKKKKREEKKEEREREDLTECTLTSSENAH
jgi:hypothetical protein